jgi:hypothetical protein
MLKSERLDRLIHSSNKPHSKKLEAKKLELSGVVKPDEEDMSEFTTEPSINHEKVK